MEQIVRDVGARYLKIGEYVALMMFGLAKQQIIDRTGVDLTTFAPITCCQHMDTPCVFVAAKDDELVLPQRIEEMFKEYRSVQRNLILVEGSHSSSRSSIDIDRVVFQIETFYRLESRLFVRSKLSVKDEQVYQPTNTITNTIDKLALKLFNSRSDEEQAKPAIPERKPD